MIPNLLFPTPVFIEQNAYGFNTDLKDAVLKQYDKSVVNWQSKPNLQTQPEFTNFHRMIYQKTKYVLDELKYGYESHSFAVISIDILDGKLSNDTKIVTNRPVFESLHRHILIRDIFFTHPSLAIPRAYTTSVTLPFWSQLRI